MLGVIGGLFMIGLSVASLISVQGCGKISFVQTVKHGSIWALFPTLVFVVSGNAYMTLLASWIPTLFLVKVVSESVCGIDVSPGEKPATKQA